VKLPAVTMAIAIAACASNLRDVLSANEMNALYRNP
jgi:hypothetical protein